MEKEYTHDVFISFSFKDQKLVEEVVNQLTSKHNIKCWICTHDIRAGEYYDDRIYDAIETSKAFVLVQSQSAVQSEEVTKELRLAAIEFRKIIVPFIIDDSRCRGGMAYHLQAAQKIDATRPEFDDRIAELAEELKKIINGDSSALTARAYRDGRLLSTPNVMPKTVFCGRNDILNEIESRYEEGERVLFLYGIGGIGKTQIAKQYAKEYKKNYDI